MARSGHTSVRSLASYARFSAEAMCSRTAGRPGLVLQRLVSPGVEDQWLQPAAQTPVSKIISPDNQALDRSQPVLPMMPGMPEQRTHVYLRHGITSLFAAFNIADGTVISELHRHSRPYLSQPVAD